MTIKLFGVPESNLYGESAKQLEYKSFLFSGGEIQVRIPDVSQYETLVVESKFPDSRDVIEIILLLNAINSSSNFEGQIKLFLPYLPYSCQDRICYDGEAFSLRVVADLLKRQLRETDKVITWDVHSPVANSVFHGIKFINVTADLLVGKFSWIDHRKGRGNSTLFIVAPDKGALERACMVAQELNVPSERVLKGEKIRNPDTGEITGVSVTDLDGNAPSIDGERVLIVDDICDGGRTFIELAKVLRDFHGAKEVNLYVTHGIFSKGFEVFHVDDRLLIDNILVANLKPGVQIPKSRPGFTSPVPIPPIFPRIEVLSRFTVALTPTI